MKRLTILALAAAAVAATSSLAQAQLKTLEDTDPRAPKTGRTEEGRKADAEVDKLYRSRAGLNTPAVKADPWGDVRTPPAAQPAGKPKQKQP